MFIEMRRSWLLAILLGASGACGSNADIPLVDPVDAGDDAPTTDDTGHAPPSLADGGVPSFDVPSPRCTATGAENTDTACADGVDNDCNGSIDCLDPSCRSSAAVCAATLDAGRPPRDAAARRDVGACTPSGAENTDSACADGVDNDCNGFVDCNDFGCSRAAAVTVCRRDGGSSIDVPPARDSGVRRDSGARRDVGPCTPSGMESTNASCSDGVDNDCDGYVDCNDFNCSRTAAVTVCHDAGSAIDVPTARDSGTRRDIGPCTVSGTESTNAACSDGVDNDCDGFVDCNDFNCSRTAAVTVCHDAGP
jgi:hypothetical protein